MIECLQHPLVTFCPVGHGRFEYALAVREQFFSQKPEAIAVEYPSTLRDPVSQAVRRLPYLSVVLYRDAAFDDYVYFPIEPHDAAVEAIRLGFEHQIPVHFVDLDVEGYPHIADPLPDSTALQRLGYPVFVEQVLHNLPETSNDPRVVFDDLREAMMAHRLSQLVQQGKQVLFVCGMHHALGVHKRLSGDCPRPIGRARRGGVTLANLAQRSSREVMSDLPFVAAAFQRYRSGEIPVAAASQVEQAELISLFGGKQVLQDAVAPEEQCERMERLPLLHVLVRQALAQHRDRGGEPLTENQLWTLFSYARRYAVVTGGLAPDLYQMVIAARGVSDDNFAYELWDCGSHYPWQDTSHVLPDVELSGDDLWLDGHKIRFRRRFPKFGPHRKRLTMKPRPVEETPGEWQKGFRGRFICSYPPEDIALEDYGRYLQKKAKKILSEETRRTVPFLSSLLDGIDLRETIRNYHEKRLYVFEKQKVRGQVGSVVVVFDEDTADVERYPWRISWHGEHKLESDMVFYASTPAEKMVGPGIARCEHGGFMLTYPPGRIANVWTDTAYGEARNKPEVLLLAAIDYSEERIVVYVGKKPPRRYMKHVAAREGKQLVYIPSGQLSPISLSKLRVLHVLDNPEVRNWAREYIY